LSLSCPMFSRDVNRALGLKDKETGDV